MNKLPQIQILKLSGLSSLIFILTIQAGNICAQSMYGTTLGNYSGVNSIQLNPGAMHNSRVYLDIQLLGTDVFLQNNYLYISKNDYRFSNFFKSGYELPTHSEEYSVEERSLYHYNNTRLKNGFVQSRINGPGAMLLWGKHAFALTTAVRTVVGARNVPYEVANFSWLGLSYQPQHNINYLDRIPVRASGASWVEIGVSYANTFYARGFNHFSAGISIRRLMSFGGFYLHTRDLNYIIPDDSTINVKNMEAEIGVALPIDYQTNAINTDKLFKGHGFGFDVGITYKRLVRYHQDQYFNSLCAQPYEDYLYRIGVALIDIGGIRYNNNAVKMNIRNRSSYWENVNHMNISNIDDFMDTLSYKFYGDTVSAYSGDKFTLWLPTALSMQFDYHIDEHWFVNSSFIYGISVARGTMVRPAELSVTPRYETGAFEVNLPVTLYNWTQPRIGLSVRIYNLTVGTEKLGGFFHFSNFTGMDLYFSLKLFFNKGNCRLKGPVHCGTEKYKATKY